MSAQIMIIGDDDSTNQLLICYLGRKGYRVITHRTLEQDPFNMLGSCPCSSGQPCADAIILDFHHLGKTGISMLDKYLSDGCRLRNKTVLASHVNSSNKAELKERGYNVLDKPFRLAELQHWLDECFKDTNDTVDRSSTAGFFKALAP